MIYRIFAYGSLINQASLKKTVPEARAIFPARAHGLQRVFNLASQHRYDSDHQRPICVVNAENAPSDSAINGTCFEMQECSLKNLLHRESGYQFRPIEVTHYHDREQVYRAYFFQARQFQLYRYLSGSSVQKHYLDLCLQGCAAIGADFVDDFIASTSFWNIDTAAQKRAIWRGEY